MEFEIKVFIENNRSYVKELLDDLEKKNKPLRNKTYVTIEKLKYQEFHRPPLSKALGEGLFELRIKHKNDIVRINYCFGPKKGEILLINGLIKKDERRQQKIIKLAKKVLIEINKKEI